MTLIEKIEVELEEFQRQIEEEKVSERGMAEREEAARQLGQRVAQVALEWILSEGGKGYEGTFLDCECGGRMKYQGDAERVVRSLVGEVRYQRGYYYCRECGQSRCPLDEKLQQSEREISAGVERQLAHLSAHMSFSIVAEVLEEVAGVEISARQMESVAEDGGAKAETKTQEESLKAQRQDLAPRLKLGLVDTTGARTWIVEMDGVMAPLQDGSWQEVKCGVVYHLDQRVEISSHRSRTAHTRAVCVARIGPGVP